MGRNAIVGQSGGPTAVINSSLVGVFQAAKSRGAQHVYGMRYGVKGLLEEQVVDLSDTLRDNLDIEILKRTPASYLGSCRYKLPVPAEDPALYEKLFGILKKLDVGYFFYIGGNDSMDTISKLSDYACMTGSDIKFMGVPKTIDNDLMNTDHTPGYGSAAKYIGAIMKEITRDSLVYGTRNVTIVEVMGRNAGWLTGAAALAKAEDCEGVDMICLPEVAFDIDHFIERLDVLQRAKAGVVIAVSEGVRVHDGRYVCELTEELGPVDAFGHKTLTGAARFLANKAVRELGCKARAIELSTLQRCSSHMASRVDITEAFRWAARRQGCFRGHSGEMVASPPSNDPYQCTTELHDIHTIANFEKKVPGEWITPDGVGVTQEFLAYMRPLIQAELTPIYVDGLPRHIYIK
ncbi:MAG: 6-phosphofructokinase [Ruthenibacterium lactatiformans]